MQVTIMSSYNGLRLHGITSFSAISFIILPYIFKFIKYINNHINNKIIMQKIILKKKKNPRLLALTQLKLH